MGDERGYKTELVSMVGCGGLQGARASLVQRPDVDLVISTVESTAIRSNSLDMTRNRLRIDG